MDHASISPEVLATYAADAARDVAGVRALSDGPLPRSRGVRIEGEDGALRVEIRLEVERGVAIPDVARAVQDRVRAYLVQMADVEAARVDVVVDGVA